MHLTQTQIDVSIVFTEEEDVLYTADDFMASDEEEETEEGQETTRPVKLSGGEEEPRPVVERPVVPPPPPATGEEGTCMVGVLLPDGRRLQRRFYRHDTIEVGIRTAVCGQNRSMALGSLRFLQLGAWRCEIEALQIETSHSRSGHPHITLSSLHDVFSTGCQFLDCSDETLESAGVHDSLLTLVWEA